MVDSTMKRCMGSLSVVGSTSESGTIFCYFEGYERSNHARSWGHHGEVSGALPEFLNFDSLLYMLEYFHHKSMRMYYGGSLRLPLRAGEPQLFS